jgi:hypothetical protein
VNADPRPFRVGVNINPRDYKTWWPSFSRARYTRVFFGPGAGAPRWGVSAIQDLPASIQRIGVSWKDAVSAGAIVRFVDDMPDGVEAELTYHHEPEPDVRLAAWRRSWQLLHDALDGHPKRDRITLVNIHTLWASRHRSQQVNWRDWMLPGVADVEGWDCYRDTAFDSYEPPESLLGLPYLAAVEFDTRWEVPELAGTLCRYDTHGIARATWYRQCIDFAAQRGCESLGFWCSTSSSGGLDYRPTDSATMASWQDAMMAWNPK